MLDKNKGRKRPRKRVALLLLLSAFALFVLAGLYSGLTVTRYTIKSDKLPAAFDGYHIAFLSDFHCYEFGRDERKLIDAIIGIEPDIIVLTGDMIDRWHDSLKPVEDLLSGISGIAPVYAVAGNHEFESGNKFEELLALYELYGVVYLNGTAVEANRGGSSVYVYGTRFLHNMKGHSWIDLQTRPADPEAYNILLNHFSDTFDNIARAGFDLVLSGHVHGGIVRLPGIGGIIGNDGFFPKYDSGVYEAADCTLICSRGLGDAQLPRFYNRRELVCVTLSR